MERMDWIEIRDERYGDNKLEFGGGVRRWLDPSRFSAIRNGTEPISYHGSFAMPH